MSIWVQGRKWAGNRGNFPRYMGFSLYFCTKSAPNLVKRHLEWFELCLLHPKSYFQCCITNKNNSRCLLTRFGADLVQKYSENPIYRGKFPLFSGHFRQCTQMVITPRILNIFQRFCQKSKELTLSFHLVGFPASGTHYPCSYSSLNMQQIVIFEVRATFWK